MIGSGPPTLNSRDGFSLLEVVIAGGIAVVLVAISLQITMQSTRQGEEELMKGSRLGERVFSTQPINEDLNRSAVSLNTVVHLVKDSSGNRRNFWEFNPDSGCTGESCKRSFTFAASEAGKTDDADQSFILLTKDDLSIPMSPDLFFKIGAAESISSPGSLEYDEAQFQAAVKSAYFSRQSDPNEARAFLVTSASPFRESASLSSDINRAVTNFSNKPARFANYLIYVDPAKNATLNLSAALKKLPAPPSGQKPYNFDFTANLRHPVIPSIDFSAAPYHSFVQFLLRVPAVRGIAGYILITPIRIIKYRLDRTDGALYREVFTSMNNISRAMLLKNIDKLKFIRSSEATSVISYELSLRTEGNAHGNQ